MAYSYIMAVSASHRNKTSYVFLGYVPCISFQSSWCDSQKDCRLFVSTLEAYVGGTQRNHTVTVLLSYTVPQNRNNQAYCGVEKVRPCLLTLHIALKNNAANDDTVNPYLKTFEDSFYSSEKHFLFIIAFWVCEIKVFLWNLAIVSDGN